MKGLTPGQLQKISDACRKLAMETTDPERRRRLLNFAITGAAIAKDKAKRCQ